MPSEPRRPLGHLESEAALLTLRTAPDALAVPLHALLASDIEWSLGEADDVRFALELLAPDDPAVVPELARCPRLDDDQRIRIFAELEALPDSQRRTTLLTVLYQGAPAPAVAHRLAATAGAATVAEKLTRNRRTPARMLRPLARTGEPRVLAALLRSDHREVTDGERARAALGLLRLPSASPVLDAALKQPVGGQARAVWREFAAAAAGYRAEGAVPPAELDRLTALAASDGTPEGLIADLERTRSGRVDEQCLAWSAARPDWAALAARHAREPLPAALADRLVRVDGCPPELARAFLDRSPRDGAGGGSGRIGSGRGGRPMRGAALTTLARTASAALARGLVTPEEAVAGVRPVRNLRALAEHPDLDAVLAGPLRAALAGADAGTLRTAAHLAPACAGGLADLLAAARAAGQAPPDGPLAPEATAFLVLLMDHAEPDTARDVAAALDRYDAVWCGEHSHTGGALLAAARAHRHDPQATDRLLALARRPEQEAQLLRAGLEGVAAGVLCHRSDPELLALAIEAAGEALPGTVERLLGGPGLDPAAGRLLTGRHDLLPRPLLERIDAWLARCAVPRARPEWPQAQDELRRLAREDAPAFAAFRADAAATLRTADAWLIAARLLYEFTGTLEEWTSTAAAMAH
ncbi:hypothetical protein BIV57_05010 [Mangrovactinospora gilvigrisea]|uniref:Uncharacterized protein n=1 Tax=Mangrovactinospora gilvigrisea TaxID=1428644 RepID=A0A1J7BJ01_9ACTN|nr:hypothetical protein [Mangrovactinospora gilvigrisea]OIV38614.1 hypothetical protein BIV57_05010 [Mangrovactinospora gilvigrisea]